MLDVVINNYCDFDRVSSLAMQISTYEFVEKIVIVENGSPDDSYIKFINFFKNVAKVFIEKVDINNGFASGTNAGFKKCINDFSADYIMCISSDVVIEKVALEKTILLMKTHRELGLISPMMLDYKGDCDLDFAWKFQTFSDCIKYMFHFTRKKGNYKKHYRIDYSKEINYVDVVRGSLMIFSRECLSKVEGFDTNTFLFHEENIICKKVHSFGFDVGIATKEKYIHNHKIVAQSSYQRYISSIKSGYYYLKEYQKISIVKRIIYKVLIPLGIMEYRIGNLIKKGLKK